MASFHRHHCWLVYFYFYLGFLIAHKCDHSFRSLLTSELLCWAIILLSYTPPSLGSLLLDSSSAVATTSSMATDIAGTPHLYPLFLPLAAHPLKIVQDHYTTAPRWYRQKVGTPAGSGVHLIVVIEGQVVFMKKKGNGYMSSTNLVLVLTNKRGRKFSHSQFLTQTD